MKNLILHLRRLALEVLNLLLNHDLVFSVVGILNKRFNFLESIFLVYPANRKYAEAYAYKRRLDTNQWSPWISGFLVQNGKLTIMFAISATNGHFTDAGSDQNLRMMADRMEEIKNLLGASRKTFAGTLPSILFKKRILREAPEADLTAEAVNQAISLVKVGENLLDTPIVILGGGGFIGRRVLKLLGGESEKVISIDLVPGKTREDLWPHHLKGQRILVVNITVNNAMSDYIDLMWPGTVVLNEVYPEPKQSVVDSLTVKGCKCYHIVGVHASAFPPFPAAYKGAVPCCAAWPSLQMKVVVRAMY